MAQMHLLAVLRFSEYMLVEIHIIRLNFKH